MKKTLVTLLSVISFALANAQETDSKLLKNGFGVESFIGAATTDYSGGDIGVGIKLANYWYFGGTEKWKGGLKSTWFRGATYFGSDVLTIQASVLNVGFANVFEFKPNIGLEVNLNLGYNVVIGVYDGYYNDYYNDYYSNDFAGGGILFNPEVKFRYNVFAIGLDFAFTKVTEYSEEEYFNGSYYEYYKRDTPFTAINFTFGAKF